jgi:hypothetical protein
VNYRQAFIILAFSALLSSGCTFRPLETGGADDPWYNAISLALSLKNTGEVPEVQTKMLAAITQDAAGFRGIEQIYVIPFQTESAIPVNAGTARLGGRNVYINNPTIGQTGLVANNNSHLYDLVSVPLRTNRVLAYGKAFDSGTVSTKEGKHKNGVLTPTGLDNPNAPGDISFSLEPVLETADLTAINQKSDNLIAALNDVVEVLQATEDADIQAFLDAFTYENQISACSYQTLYRLEQSILGALSVYNGTNPDAINAVMIKLSDLQTARNAVGSGFPSAYGIPEGAVGMWWNGHRFVKLITGVNISLVPMTGYCYPPSLWYYANSTVKTSANAAVKEQYKPLNYTWGSILSYYTEGNSVQSSTRSVAIVDQMEYGVGLVEFHFLAPSGNAVSAAGCPLTGIIIGDQKDVDYSFAPNSSESRFIYDNTMTDIKLGGTNQYVQMLVLPTADDQAVHFALEFQNNTSSSFQCQQGTIQPGCKFYLAGELKPGAGTKPDGESIVGVFDSDYKTTVYVRVNDLGNAYNTVPDLRDPQLELGVVAEIDWMQVEPGGLKLPF